MYRKASKVLDDSCRDILKAWVYKMEMEDKMPPISQRRNAFVVEAGHMLSIS